MPINRGPKLGKSCSVWVMSGGFVLALPVQPIEGGEPQRVVLPSSYSAAKNRQHSSVLVDCRPVVKAFGQWHRANAQCLACPE